MALAKRTVTIALATAIATVLALTCAPHIGVGKAYAATTRPTATVSADNDGQVSISVNNAKKAKKYQYKVAKDKKLKKKAYAKTTSKRSITVKGLTPGKTYYVAVRVRGANGWGKWSKAKRVTVTKHTHDYQLGGNYAYYHSQAVSYRRQQESAAFEYTRLMQSGYLTGYYNAARLNELKSERDSAKRMADYYEGLAKLEYYCTVCGAQKPIEGSNTLTAARLQAATL